MPWLLKHAGPHLRAVITAAPTTGCRLGELLSLQWSRVRRDDKGEARWLVLPSTKTKTAVPRVIPIAPRLRAELEMRRHAVDGKEHPPNAFIFGDETGGEVKSIRRAWETAVLKAHGHTPDWIAEGKLSRESTAILRGVDLHFHDLRRQFALHVARVGRRPARCAGLARPRQHHDYESLPTEDPAPTRPRARADGGWIRTPFAHRNV
jgi:integrase